MQMKICSVNATYVLCISLRPVVDPRFLNNFFSTLSSNLCKLKVRHYINQIIKFKITSIALQQITFSCQLLGLSFIFSYQIKWAWYIGLLMGFPALVG